MFVQVNCASEHKVENMNQEVQHFNRLHELDKEHHDKEHCHENCLTEGTVSSGKTRSDHENNGECSNTGAGDCLANLDDGLSPKYSYYPNGATRLADIATDMYNKSSYNCEQRTMGDNKANSCLSLTTQQTPDKLPLQSHACKTEITETDVGVDYSNGNQVTCHKSSTKENEQRSPGSEDDTELAVTDDCEKATVIIDGASLNVNRCAEMPRVDSVTCQDKVQQYDSQIESLQPLDFSVSGLGKTGAYTSRKPTETSVPDDLPKTHSKHNIKSDSYRPVGRLLHDLGLELVREQVYRDLIDIQTAKDANNRLEEREKGQLLKLIEAQERLAARNKPYQLPTKCCSRCSFMSPSTNVMALHHEFGTVSRVDATMHVCCLCSGLPGFRTRNAAQFMIHLSTDHGLTGRLMKKMAPYACKNCLFEHKSSVRLTVHVEKCSKKFSLTTNLQPLPGDCDIPLMYRPSDRKRPGGSPHVQSDTSSHATVNTVGPPSVRTLLSSFRHEISAGYPGNSYNQQAMPSLICEICGKLVDGREALWGHFRSAHHVELCRTTMRDKEPWMKCDVCSGRFWTYQGLSRHLLLAHNRALAASFASATPVTPTIARCHICGNSQTSNPLSHFSAYHNVTLLEMYHAKLCCMCNRKVNSGRAFEEHMVELHSDIFANYDVLRTVLQALTTARYFKADDTREPTTQHIMQLSARGGRNTDGASGVRKKFTFADSASSAGECSGNYAAADLADKKSMMAASGSSQTVERKRNSSGVISPQSTQKKRLNTNTSATKRKFPTVGNMCGGKKHVSAADTQSSVAKANDKGATVEEVKKLYEDLADIGRPILRSMRRKLSTNSEVKNAEHENSISLQNTSISSTDEISVDEVHLQNTEKVCDETDNTI